MASSQSSPADELVANKDDPPLDTAIIYQSETSNECGHTFKMEPLMDYLEGKAESSSANKKINCPVCQGPIEMVCDGMVSTLQDQPKPKLLSEGTVSDDDRSTSDKRLVKFKYRNHLFHLSVMRSPMGSLSMPHSWFLWMWHTMLHFVGENTAVTAQERIAHVLRMDMQKGMRILHKGKILYPNVKHTPQEISLQLLEVCEKGGKPLVMGTRMTEKEQKLATVKWLFNLWLGVVRACLAKTISLVQGIVSPLLSLGGGAGGAVDDQDHRHQD